MVSEIFQTKILHMPVKNKVSHVPHRRCRVHLRCWRFRRKKKNVIKVKLSVCVHERKKVLKKWWKKEEEEFLLSFDTSANIHTCWEITVCGEQTQTTEILDSVKLLAFNLNTHSFLFDHIITRPDPEPLQHIKPHVFPIY